MSHRVMENVTSIWILFFTNKDTLLSMKIEQSSDNFLLSLFKVLLILYMKYTLGVSDILEEPEHPLLSLLKTIGSAYSCHCM